jgi:hypothetical protein
MVEVRRGEEASSRSVSCVCVCVCVESDGSADDGDAGTVTPAAAYTAPSGELGTSLGCVASAIASAHSQRREQCRRHSVGLTSSVKKLESKSWNLCPINFEIV